MSKLVQIPGGPTLEFPDDASDQQITDVLSRDFPAPAPSSQLANRRTLAAMNNFSDMVWGTVPPRGGTDLQAPARAIGRATQAASQGVIASLGDLGDLAFGEAIANVIPEAAQPDAGEPPSNIQAFAQREPLPAQTQLSVLPPALEATARAGQGLAGSAPQMAAIMGLEAVGIPPIASAPVLFGSTPEGFDPQQAAIATALPFVGRYGGEITGALSRKLGVSTVEAENIFRRLGGAGAAAAYLGTIDFSKVAGSSQQERHGAVIDAVANMFSQAALGGTGAEPARMGPGEFAGRELLRTIQAEPGPQQTEALGDSIEREAALGGEPTIQEGARAAGPTVITPSNLPPAKPPITPRPEIPRAPGRLFRPIVPEGPPAEEPRTAVEEIRLANARTIREIQELFPKAQLSREQARQWRTAAWGPRAEAEPTATPAEEPATSAEVPAEEAQDRPAQPGGGTTATREPLPETETAAPADTGEVPAVGVARFEQDWDRTQGNQFSTQVGLELSQVQDLDRMLEHRLNDLASARRWTKVAEQAKDTGDVTRFTEAMQAAIEIGQRAQLAREAIEVATSSGSWEEGVAGTKLGARPLDWRSNPEIAQWLKANADKAGIAFAAPAARPAAPEPTGAQFTASTPVANVKVKGQYGLAEAGQLLTSEDFGFDPALQPRDRTRLASAQQIASIARALEPQRLGNSPTTDTGAPIVDESGQVLSGNGRVQALRQAYRHADRKSATAYKDFLLANADEFGLDRAQIEAMDQPVLVRQVTDYGGLDKVEFTRQSNQQQVAGMSEAEKASADARMLLSSPNLLEVFRPGEEGNVLAASNREFLNAFIQGTGDQAELLSKEGYNAPALTRRVRNAVLGAFIGPENRTLLNQLLEEADTLNVKNAVNGAMAAAPGLVRFKGTDYDLSNVAAQAFKDLVQLRKSGEKLDDFLGTKPLFADPGRTAASDLVLAFLHQGKSTKAVTEGLQRYIDGAREALQDVQSGGMLGTVPATRQELIERATGGRQQTTAQPELSQEGGRGSASQRTPAPLPAGQPESPLGQPAVVGQTRPTPGPQPLPAGATLRIQKSAGGPGWDIIQGPAGQGRVIQAGLTKRQAESLVARANASPGASQSAFRALEEETPNLPLHEDARASQAANTALRGAQQARNPPLGQAGSNLVRSAGGPRPGSRWFLGLRKVFAPHTIDDEAQLLGMIIRHSLGFEYEKTRQADFALRQFRRDFDRTPVSRNWQFTPGEALPRNYEVMRAIDTGELDGLTPIERQFHQVMRSLFDEAIDLVQGVSPNSLRELLENYFPRLWRDPEANRDKLNALLSRRPWEGPKTFLRRRVLAYFTDGLQLGLKPASDNPVDVAIAKLGEMYRFTATRRAIAEAKDRGLYRFFYVYEKKPAGWRKYDDPSSTQWAPPTVTVKEAFEGQVRAKTLELLEALDVPHERLVSIGGKRWGFAEPATGRIVSKFGGPDAVIWHEFGHQMDFRYPDLRDMLPTAGKSSIANELRALAELRYEGSTPTQAFKDYVHEAVEKYANMFHAYIRMPQRFQRIAPNLWRGLQEWLDLHPEVKNPLNEVRGTFQEGDLTLGVGQAEQFVGGPVKLGDWMMPEGAAQVTDNYLKPGFGKYAWFRSLREIAGLANGIQLAGFFHGDFVMNDSFYSGIGLAIYDGMQAAVQGRPELLGRAVKEAAQIPISPLTSLYRGHRIKAALENPAAANVTYRRLADLAVEQNLRAGHGNYDPQFSRRWVRAFNETRQAFSLGAAWETLWRSPWAAVQATMSPVMDFLVPRMKLGIYARMAERVVADFPNAGPDELRRRLGMAADATEDRLGQVTYDNQFQMRAVKDGMQLAMRAYGWQLTKYRMTFGAVSDYIKAGNELAHGRAPEITFRMGYLPAMVLGHAVLGGVIHYALTGRRPDKLIDYLFPESGLIDAYGQPVRLAIADFVKDYVADFRSFPNPYKMSADFGRKLSALWSMGAEMYRNQDFWGTEIFSKPRLGEPALDHFMTNVWEGMQYLGQQTLPFSVRGAQRLKQAGANAGGAMAPFFGLTPAPRYATQTKAEARADELMRELLPKRSQTKEAAARGIAEAQIVRDLRTGKINTAGELEAAAKAAKINVNDQREVTKLRERVFWSPLQYKVNKMGAKLAMEELWDLASEPERISLSPILAKSINAGFNSGSIDEATARHYLQLVIPFLKKFHAQPKPGRPAAAAQRPYSAFAPANP